MSTKTISDRAIAKGKLRWRKAENVDDLLRDDDTILWHSRTPLYQYIISPAPEGSRWKHPYIWGFFDEVPKDGSYCDAESVEAAKIACQRHSDAQIRRIIKWATGQ